MGNKEKKRLRSVSVNRIIIYVILIVSSVISIFPLGWVFISSLKSNSGILMSTLSLPKEIVTENYVLAWENGKLVRYYLNTVIVAVGSSVITVLFSSMATYILARVRPNLILYTYFVIGMILPVYVIMLPLFKILSSMKLTNSLFGLILVDAAVLIPQTFFILFGYMKDIPREIEEAAIIDGCSFVGTYRNVIMPMSRPGLATVGVFALLFAWNDYLLPLVLTTGDKSMILSLSLLQFQTNYTTNYGGMMARMVLSILPVMILYLLLQNNLVKGITAGAVKG